MGKFILFCLIGVVAGLLLLSAIQGLTGVGR